MTNGNPHVVRRVTVYEDHAGEWRYRVQAGNWRVVETAEEGLTRATVLRRVRSKFPGVELVELPHDPERVTRW